MEKEAYRPGLSKDATLVEQLKELQKNPNSLVFAALGERYRSKGLVKQALEILEEGLGSHADFAPALVAKARCYFDLRRYADCLEILEKVLRKNSENIRAEKLRAEVYQRLGQRKAAMGALGRVIRLMPNDRESVKALEQLENLHDSRPEAGPRLLQISLNPPAAIGQVQDFQVRNYGESALPMPVRNAELVLETSPAPAKAPPPKQDGVADSWDEDDEAASTSFGDITFATRTIADLYLRQGLREKAKRVLQLMLEREPNDAWARETLQKLLPSNGNNNVPQAKRTQLMLKAQYLERLLARVHGVKRVNY